MKIIKASNFVGQTDYFWVNVIEELPLNFRKNYYEVNQVPIDSYIEKINNLAWFKLDLDTWDRISSGKHFHQINSYLCAVLSLEEYDQVGLIKNNFYSVKRIESLTQKINLMYPEITVDVNKTNGRVTLIKIINFQGDDVGK